MRFSSIRHCLRYSSAVGTSQFTTFATLLASLAGSIIAAFSVLVRQSERLFKLSPADEMPLGEMLDDKVLGVELATVGQSAEEMALAAQVRR